MTELHDLLDQRARRGSVHPSIEGVQHAIGRRKAHRRRQRTIGGGIDFALSENLIIRAEYLYDDYGSEDYHIVGLSEYDACIDLTGSTLRGGIAYKFPLE